MTAHLLNEDDRRLYREVLAQGGRVMFREAVQQDPDTTLRLIELGLLVHFENDESLTAVNPRTVGARLSADLRADAGRRLAEADRAAAELSDQGQRFRVLDEPFTRLLIFDRRTAIIPAAADNTSAAFIGDPTVVASPVTLFERDWARAAIVDWHALAGRPRESGVPPELTDLLAAGLTQKAIATRLHLSERTVAAHLARLREHHSAETLFQLGWLMYGGAR